MDPRDRIVQIIKEKGPVIPLNISKELGINTIFSGAMLSELTDKKILKITHAKMGGSPLYYLPGQEKMLEMLFEKLPEKHQKAYSRLKQNLVLRESEQEPVIRAALRELKDFAIPLEVQAGDIKETFWKWYLTTDDEAARLIKQKLGIKEEKEEKKQAKEQSTQKILDKKIEERERGAKQKKEEEISDELKEKLKDKIRRELEQQTFKKKEIQKRIVEVDDKSDDDDLFKRAFAYFKRNDIQVLEYKILRKNSEIDFIVLLPSPVGALKYFCKVLGKKRVSEGDIATVYVAGQKKHLPILLLTTGDVAKKAMQKIVSEYSGLTVKKF